MTEKQAIDVSPVYTNGHEISSNDSLERESSVVVKSNEQIIDQEEKEIEEDNDDGQWSDWEQPPIRSPSPPIITIEIPLEEPRERLTSKPLPKSRWNPNAPLGSEYEIPPVVLSKKKINPISTVVNEDTDDFFKDMTPKVETVELMRQLETMFSVDGNPSEQNDIPTKSSSTSFSKKFGVLQSDQNDHQETESGNNWDD